MNLLCKHKFNLQYKAKNSIENKKIEKFVPQMQQKDLKSLRAINQTNKKM